MVPRRENAHLRHPKRTRGRSTIGHRHRISGFEREIDVLCRIKLRLTRQWRLGVAKWPSSDCCNRERRAFAGDGRARTPLNELRDRHRLPRPLTPKLGPGAFTQRTGRTRRARSADWLALGAQNFRSRRASNSNRARVVDGRSVTPMNAISSPDCLFGFELRQWTLAEPGVWAG